jgi:hypothetical protein
MTKRHLRWLTVSITLVCFISQLAVAQSPSPEDNGSIKWVITLATDPVVLRSQDFAFLSFNTQSPKKVITVGFLRIFFQRNSVTVESSSRMPGEGLAIHPGNDSGYLVMPTSLVDAAKKAGANRIKIDLIINGVVRSSDSATIDYDLVCTPSADPNTGSGSLQVQLHANAQGGIPPYSYEWYFYGDTGSSGDEGPIHNYNKPGLYLVGVVVTDSIGGEAWGQIQVEVNCPVLNQ